MTDPSKPEVLHIICERDVGLFALIISVVAHIYWALSEGRIPIVYYRERNCYWTPNGYRDRDSVWEYYFEPVVPAYPVSRIPSHIREAISARPPVREEFGHFLDEFAFVSNHPGGHIQFEGERVKGASGSEKLKLRTSTIIRDYVRPRDYIREKVDHFFQAKLAGRYIIGVHIRGTDALIDPRRKFRESRINFESYFTIIERLLGMHPEARIFVASDAQASVDKMCERFGDRIVTYDSIRHESGELAGRGPTGRIMPAYLTSDADRAARNGEEAVIEYLLLCRCSYLVHNGSSIPYTVLLTVPGMPASNTRAESSALRRAYGLWRRRSATLRETFSEKPVNSYYRLVRELWTARRAARKA